jgi:hypothetical protein
MINFYVFNYSVVNDAIIEGYLKSFVKHLKDKGVKTDFQIERCGESIKNRFKEIINDESKGALSNNDDFESAVYSYHGELSNNEYGNNYKFIFIGETLYCEYPWGDAKGDWFAVIRNVHEKAIWHEIAHLIGAEDHYDPQTHEASSICSNPSNCIMTHGKLKGELCPENIREIRMALCEYLPTPHTSK